MEIFCDDIIMNISMIISFVLFSFLMFLLITFIISSAKAKARTGKGFEPEISVLVPAYNEEKNIVPCLDSILQSDYRKSSLHVIVIDDGSKDKTAENVERFIRKHPGFDVKLVHGKHEGKAAALNLGLRHCKDETILSLDADSILQKSTIRNLIFPLTDKKVAATNAVALIRDPKNMVEYFQMIEFGLNNLIRVSFSRVFGNSIWFFGAVACYRKSILLEVGGFKKDTLTEDMDLCLELYSKDYKIVTVPDAVITTQAEPHLKGLFRQRMRWYYGALQSLYKSRHLLSPKKTSPPVLFLFFNQYWWTFFAFIFFPMTAYQVYYWFPEGVTEAVSYILRWFSIAGPFYVLYKIPDWGLNTLNIFGVMSGIITLAMSLAAMYIFRGRFNLKAIICLIFYFPYTIVQDAIIITGIIKYSAAKKKYFIN